MARNIRGACIRLGLLGLLGPLGPLGIACEARSLDHGIGEMEMRFAQDAATAYCEVLLACDCPENWERYADEASCIEQESEYIAEVQRRAQEGGLQFDTECAAFTLGRWGAIGCDDFEAAALRLRPSSSSANNLFPACRLYYGSVPEGEQCENAFGTIWDDCEQGSDCEEDETRGSRCTALEPFQTDPPGLGEPCVGGEPTARYSCEAPLYCAGMFQVETTTCQPYAGEGESCERTACAEGLLCDYGAGSTCRPPSPAGSPCSFVEFSDCGDGQYCDRGGIETADGVCAPRLEPGATCSQLDGCREGACSCDPSVDGPCEGTCIADAPPYPIICEPGTSFAPHDRF